MDWDESDSIFLNSLPDITDEERHFIKAETLKSGPFAGSLGANKYKLLMSIIYKLEKGFSIGKLSENSKKDYLLVMQACPHFLKKLEIHPAPITLPLLLIIQESLIKKDLNIGPSIGEIIGESEIDNVSMPNSGGYRKSRKRKYHKKKSHKKKSSKRKSRQKKSRRKKFYKRN